jgi:hypothetical protein
VRRILFKFDEVFVFLWVKARVEHFEIDQRKREELADRWVDSGDVRLSHFGVLKAIQQE